MYTMCTWVNGTLCTTVLVGDCIMSSFNGVDLSSMASDLVCIHINDAILQTMYMRYEIAVSEVLLN